jgi:type III pantothenate kinase
MLLCIDVGNSNIKLGLFEGEQMVHHWRITTVRDRLADEYAMLLLDLIRSVGCELGQISGCAVSSVVPELNEVFAELAQRYLGIPALILGPGVETGIQVNTDYPAEVGSDLIVNALAARYLVGAPAIIIGFGTATTFSAISAEGDFEGVAIAPGIISSGDSLFRSTATLPRVALARPESAIGRNTIRSLQAGLVFGFAGLVEGVVTRMQAELGGSARVIATGGVAALIAPETKVIEVVEPNLALIGLRLLYQLNQ